MEWSPRTKRHKVVTDDCEAYSVYFGGDAAGGYKAQCMAV